MKFHENCPPRNEELVAPLSLTVNTRSVPRQVLNETLVQTKHSWWLVQDRYTSVPPKTTSHNATSIRKGWR